MDPLELLAKLLRMLLPEPLRSVMQESAANPPAAHPVPAWGTAKPQLLLIVGGSRTRSVTLPNNAIRLAPASFMETFSAEIPQLLLFDLISGNVRKLLSSGRSIAVEIAEDQVGPWLVFGDSAQLSAVFVDMPEPTMLANLRNHGANLWILSTPSSHPLEQL